jgi:hypothetical protein
MILLADRNIYGPATGPGDNQGFGNSPKEAHGSRVALGTNYTRAIGWTGKLHRDHGNAVFGDGSVLKLNSESLRKVLSNTGDAQGNTICFP